MFCVWQNRGCCSVEAERVRHKANGRVYEESTLSQSNKSGGRVKFQVCRMGTVYKLRRFILQYNLSRRKAIGEHASL